MRWFSLLFLALLPGPVLAWESNGVRLTGAPDDQAGPLVASDGTGGAFVAWADWRNFSADNQGPDLYLQRVTATGVIASGWLIDGLAIAIGPRTQGVRSMLPDGSGGVFIAFADTRLDAGDLYLQRITSTGVVAPGWPAEGVPIGVAPGQQGFPELVVADGGGVFVSWQDGMDSAIPSARYLHVAGDGQIAPGWPTGGRLFEPGPLVVTRPMFLASDASGFLACWGASDDGLATARMLAQRYLANGTADPAWPAGGVVICPALPLVRGPEARLVPDGAGGFYTVFADYRNSPPGSPYGEVDLYAQHVLGIGAVAPGWPADGLPVSALQGVTEQAHSLCEDGRGGVFIAWEDYRVGAARIFGQHLLSDGERHAGWPALGLSLSAEPVFQLSPQLAWDGWRGAYLTWMTLGSGGYRSFVQHLSAGGTPVAGWPPSGLPVVPIATDQYVPQITADGRGGAIVAWEDIRDGVRDVYAQRFVTDGVVAATVSLASAEATPDEVRVRWHVSGESRASVERREGESVWQARAQLELDGAGYMSHVDRDVTPGTRYSYRLAFASGTRGGETSVVVPASLVLALEGARPNPAAGALWVAFTLPDDARARLELFDLAGRQVAARDVSRHGAGHHVVRLDDGPLSPGLYWASLTQGPHVLRERVVVVK